MLSYVENLWFLFLVYVYNFAENKDWQLFIEVDMAGAYQFFYFYYFPALRTQETYWSRALRHVIVYTTYH